MKSAYFHSSLGSKHVEKLCFREIALFNANTILHLHKCVRKSKKVIYPPEIDIAHLNKFQWVIVYSHEMAL